VAGVPIRWLERILLVVGVVCLGIYAYAFVDARLTDRAENRRLEEAIREHQRQQAAADTDSFSSFQPHGIPPKLSEGELVGRLDIPRLGVSAIVLEGVGSTTLRRGIGHIPGTDFPQSSGNIGIAGHRDTFFRPLKDIQRDDVIQLRTPEGTYRYRVDWTRIVLPEDGEVLDEPGPALTLVTCYPFFYVGSAPKRFIVRAREIGSEDASGGRIGQR
jgi:sortase A